MGAILNTKKRLYLAERERERLEAENEELKTIVEEQADALIELAGIIEEGEE